MGRGVACLAGVSLLCSLGAEAAELNLSAETSVGFDSNTANRPSSAPLGDIPAATFRVGATGRLTGKFEAGDYQLSYSPEYFYNSSKQVNDRWNQQATVVGTYRLSPRTNLSIRNYFLFLERVALSPVPFDSFDPDAPPAPVDDPDLEEVSRRTIRNVFQVGGNHMIRPRWSAYSGANFTIYRFSSDLDSDSDAISGRLGTTYQLTRFVQIGMGAGASYRSFAGRRARGLVTVLPPAEPVPTPDVPRCFGQVGPRSRSLSYSGFATLAYQFDHSTRFTVQAGPARIESEDYFCPSNFPSFLFPQGVTTGSALAFQKIRNNQTTWFAEGEFFKTWRQLRARIRFGRQQGLGAGGNGAITDTLVGGLSWQVSRLWGLGLDGNWLRRDAFSGRQSSSWTASASVNRRFFERLTGRLTGAYRSEAYSSPTAYDVWQVSMILRYALDPIRF